MGIDCNNEENVSGKKHKLKFGHPKPYLQSSQSKNPDSRIILGKFAAAELLESFAQSYQGIKTGDDPRFRRFFFEVVPSEERWKYHSIYRR